MISRIASAIPLALLLAAPAAAQDSPLAWLSGCWGSEDGSAREVWSADEGGVLFGYGVQHDADGQVSSFEQLRIEADESGALAYIASPNGAAPTRFVSVLLTPNRARFTNAEHDYPQAIEYAREGDALAATISLIDGSNPVEYRWTRCE